MNSYQEKKAREREQGTVRSRSRDVCLAMFGPTKYQEPMRHLLGEEGPIARSLPGYQSRPMQVMLAEAIYQGLCEKKHVIAEAGTGSGKCIRKGTLVALADGTHRPIEDLVGTIPLLLSVNPTSYKTIEQRARSIFASGTKTVYKITTSLGREIWASADHRFLTIEGWKPLSKLTVSDRLVSMRSLPEPGELATIPRSHLSLLALAIADGSCTSLDNLQYTKEDPALQAEFVAACESFENCTAGLVNSMKAGLMGCKRVVPQGQNAALLFLSAMGVMGKKSVEKYIHPDVFRMSNDDIAFFLGRLFSGDGCVETRGSISYSTSSRQLAADVQTLLLRINIQAKVRHRLASCDGKKFDAWELVIRDSPNIARFCRTVGPHVIGVKTARVTFLAENLPQSNPNRDLIPREIEARLRALAESNGLTWKKLRNLVGLQHSQTSGYSLAKLASLHEILGDNLIDLGNVFWDEVEAIEMDGRHETYDITMWGEPNFVANGLVVHNSMAGLVPAIHWVMEQGGAKANHRILVSTAMLILQDQYTKKDLPFLEEHLGYPFEWTKRKGRSNYACDLRVTNADEDRLPVEQRHLLGEVLEWTAATHTGDLAELPFEVAKLPELKAAVTIKGSKCGGRKCDYFEGCFYYASKDRAVNCEIIVVNHALLVLNCLYNGMILPEYDAVIIDEAHKLEEIVRNNLAEELSLKTFLGILEDAEKLELFAADKLASLKAIGELNLMTIESTLLKLVKHDGKQRFAAGTLPPEFADWLGELRDVVAQVYLSARRLAEVEGEGGDGGAKDLVVATESLGKAIAAFQKQDPAYVIWGDRRTGKKDGIARVHLGQAPIKVGPWMKDNLLQKPCVFLSATIATGQGEDAFVAFKEALGIDRAIELQVPSPFDYANRTKYSLGYYPAGPAKPPSDAREWASIITPRIKLVLELTKGGALVLFTSRKVMNEVHWDLEQANAGQWLLLKQDDASKDQLIEMFKTGWNSVLCATSSFFEGVDIPGNKLRCVIIDKIPFPMPSDPIQEAIAESFGKEGFNKHSIPYAITTLKQGVGRLNRAEDDKGLLVLLDPRMRSAGYAKKILSQLPGYKDAAQADEIREFMADIIPADELLETPTPRPGLSSPAVAAHRNGYCVTAGDIEMLNDLGDLFNV